MALGWVPAITLSGEGQALGFCLDLTRAATARHMRPQHWVYAKNNFIRVIILIFLGTLLVLYSVQLASSLAVT